MTSQNTDISLCSAALTTIGADEIGSFQDETREALVCRQHYGLIVDDLLTRHPWRFAVNQKQLDQLDAVPLFGYQYAYQLPTDMLDLLNMELGFRYEICEDKLYTDADAVNVTYKFRPQESKFPPHFVRLVIFELAAILSVALMEDKDKMQLYTKLAEKQEAKAKHTDSKQQPSRAVRSDNFTLITARQC